MRPDQFVIALATSLALGAAAQAAPVQLDPVQVGEDLAEKSEDYGARDVERLVEDLTEAITERLEREGHRIVTDPAEIRIAVTLEDAWPNRPTRGQLADQPGLSLRSISLGGASVSAVLYDETGAQMGGIEYSWRTHHISDSVGLTTWSDAERTFDRFARNLAEQLPDAPS